MNDLRSVNAHTSIGYIKQLDGLRAIAVFAVIYTHYLPEQYWLLGQYWGGFGVRLFFILSGFLITRILLKARNLAELNNQHKGLVLKRFYIRRLLRIFPLYYLFLLFYYLFDIASTRDNILGHGFFLSNVYFGLINDFQGAASHLWSLAVEEQFYLVWPWLVLLLPKKKVLISVIVFLILIAPFSRYFGYLLNFNEIAIGTSMPANLDALGMGALLAWLVSEKQQQFWARLKFSNLWILAGIALIVFVRLVSFRWEILTELNITTENAILLWLTASACKGFTGLTQKILEFPPMVYIGKISYGIYLFHLLPPLALEGRLRTFELPISDINLLVSCLLWVAITVTLAAISWHLVEKPINSQKKYFPYVDKG